MDYNAVADSTQQQHSEMLIFGQSEYITALLAAHYKPLSWWKLSATFDR